MISAEKMRERPPIHKKTTFAKMCSKIWYTSDLGGQVTWYAPTDGEDTNVAQHALRTLDRKSVV